MSAACGCVSRYGQTVAAGQEGDIMFVPQRPYMVLGSLREQVLYPTWATSPALTPDEDADHAQSAAARQVAVNSCALVLYNINLQQRCARPCSSDSQTLWWH